jgi:hypothetical protein
VWLVVFAACGGSSPPPTAKGTILCEPELRMLDDRVPDGRAATERLQRSVIAQVSDRAFVQRVAAAEGVDEKGLAVSAHIVEDSRLVEVDVVLADGARAIRVCDAILDRVFGERIGDGEHDVRVGDRCGP